MPGSGPCRGSLCQREISEEVEDERVGLVRCFRRDEMRGARDFDDNGRLIEEFVRTDYLSLLHQLGAEAH
jgi:hypothetical protein